MVTASLRAIVALGLVALVGTLDGCLGPRSNETESSGSGVDVATDGTGVVTSIVDGDTLRLDVDGVELRVRLIGIDTPEVYPELECFGEEATAELERLAPVGSTLQYAYDRDPRDPYDRNLLYLTSDDGTFINLAMVENGFAFAVLFEPNDAYWPELQDAERSARDAGRGLWGSC